MAGKTTPVKEEKPTSPESKKRIAGIHNGMPGIEYQIYLTLYILLKSYDIYSPKGRNFELRMEPTDPSVGKFDDISLKVGRKQILIQVKYSSTKSRLTEGNLTKRNDKNNNLPTKGVNLNRSLYEMSDSITQRTTEQNGEATFFVFLTTESMNKSASAMFVPHNENFVLSHIFHDDKFWKISKDHEKTKDLCQSRGEFFNDFILFPDAPDRSDLEMKIKAEIKKRVPADYEFCMYFLIEELRKWVCEKENRERKHIGEKWIQERFEDFRRKQKIKWKKYENLVISTIKKALQSQSANQTTVRAQMLFDKIKHILTNGALDNAIVKKEIPTMEQPACCTISNQPVTGQVTPETPSTSLTAAIKTKNKSPGSKGSNGESDSSEDDAANKKIVRKAGSNGESGELDGKPDEQESVAESIAGQVIPETKIVRKAGSKGSNKDSASGEGDNLIADQDSNNNFKHVCGVCGFKAKFASLLLRHTKVHTNERPHKCDHCEERFKDKTALKMHMNRCQDLRPYNCTECNLRFNQPGTLTKHMLAKHKIKK